jgi:two-component system, NtrC family, sensor histidine kinase HydH
MAVQIWKEMKMINKKGLYMVALLASTVIVSYLHHSIFRQASPDIILKELYYIPLLLGALFFGLKGALLVYLFTSASYLPYLFEGWTMSSWTLMDRVSHLFFTGIFAALAGFLVERERKRFRQSEMERSLAGIGRVAASIVHDLKNPLITILGFTRRLRERKGDADEAVRIIEESAFAMQRIVHEVLDYAKPIHIQLKEEDLTTLVKSSQDVCRTKAEENGVSLLIETPTDPIMIPLDKVAMQRALVNVITNAIEASPKGKDVLVSAEIGKKTMRIRIKDYGSGMDKQTIENVFTPFFTKKSCGTGLGMAIVKKVIDEHGGSIHIASKPGHGTEVLIELPLKAE